MSISTTSDELLPCEIAFLLCYAQRRTRVACFYKQQHDQHAHQVMHDYTLSERDILEKLLRPTVNEENALSRSRTGSKRKYLLARSIGRDPR
jgi:hypothetical protein